MADLATITTAITSIKTATDIVKALRQADLSLDKAEMKLKLADLMDNLAEARIKTAEVQEVLAEKDRRIGELERAMENKSRVTRYADAYYEIDENGKPKGDAYCSHCWEASHILIHLAETNSTYSHCPKCKNSFRRNRVPSLIQSVDV